MPDTRTIAIPTHVMFREVGGETVLLNLETETYFGLDDLGTEILRLMRQGASVEETIAALVESWEVAADVLAQDIDDLIGELVEHGLVEWR